jgi:glycolate oxidase iron-sulfur subunit
MARAVEACVHCGFCLPACPTYRVLGEEMDSPRGRIFLMKEVLEGALPLEEALPFVDRCLGCLGCVTACPSGVNYGELLTPFREHAERSRRRALPDRLVRWLVLQSLPYPGRFRWALVLGHRARPLLQRVGGRLQALAALLPDRLPPQQGSPAVVQTAGEVRARVGVLEGCVQRVLRPAIHAATVRVLARNGVEVVVPPGQGCCGALAMHAGEGDLARRLAARNLRAFGDLVDAVLTNAAGCGSAMREYGLLFAGRPEEGAARELAERTRDVSEFLDQLGLAAPPPSLPARVRVAYHDACHLAHAQGVRDAPRKLLRSVPNVDLVEIPDGDVCCGSAGTYNLEHPEVAAELGRRKAQAVLQTGAEAVVTGNLGCMVQLEAHLRALGRPLPVLHTVEVLDRAYAGEPLVPAGRRPSAGGS